MKATSATKITLCHQVRRRPTISAGIGLNLSSGVRQFFDSHAMAPKLADYVVEGNSAQLRDTAFMGELKGWLRFNEREVVASMDGLFSGAFGKPSLPGWLARLLLPFAFTESGENGKYRAHIKSSG